ncbi:hypothetical protein J1N35_009245 [Gossypium stocksii]|uniref:GIY-YIG domain-containing protein n=1 Tax=Gossypium stocksii TaxID=47602 RepID=A0A9D4A9F7_9ROSI|nr:hypothetical protein J1N35_009245 [Gossypium stocksii]
MNSDIKYDSPCPPMPHCHSDIWLDELCVIASIYKSGAITDSCIMVLIVEEDEIPLELLAVLDDRLNREDHKKIDRDSHFSEWKLLICPHDWKKGKGGAVTRYRFENLPKSSGPGIYELAVCKLPSRDRRGKLEPDSVVYVGEAENIRARLQQYGRAGTHLCRNNGFGEKGCPLFDKIFARVALLSTDGLL